MPLKFFVIPVRDGGATEAALNAFLRGHRVLAMERRWVEQGSDSFWSICVDYLEVGVGDAGAHTRTRGKDYKALLSPEDFAVFAQLRELRKELAQAEAVPVYTVFSNEHLAQMVQSRARTQADLAKIGGVGDARIDKYGQRFLDLLARQWPNGTEP